MRKCIPSPTPFGRLSRRPASTLVRFADRDPIDGMACVLGAIEKLPHCDHSVPDLFSKVNWYRVHLLSRGLPKLERCHWPVMLSFLEQYRKVSSGLTMMS
jgi:hypothetical protein